jgi:hypothetical protein
MTSAFQWIIDRAESISINRKHMVAQTTARDGSVRSISRGLMPKRFTVKLPDGIPWTEIKSFIAAAEAVDRFTEQSIEISAAGQAWYYGQSTIPSNKDSWVVVCTSFPEWTLFARNQVSWSGPFIFTEVPQ